MSPLTKFAIVSVSPMQTSCSAMDCPLDEFLSFIERRLKLYGTWEQTCSYGTVNQSLVYADHAHE